MRGSKLGALVTLAVTAAGCAQPLLPARVRPAPEPGSAACIVVLKSSDNPLLDVPLETFIADVPGKIVVFSTPEQVDPEALAAAVTPHAPSLILALGAKATLSARALFPQTPLLFAMVVNYKRHKLGELPGVMGIALETPPAVEFMQFKMVIPTLTRVLALYSPTESSAMVAEAREALLGLGVELLAVPVQSPEEVAAAYEQHKGEADGVWFLNDALLMNATTFAYLKDSTLRDHKAFVSSLSDRFARAGALASVSVDFTSLGSQAAAMARAFLNGAAPVDIGIQPPIGSKLAVNQDVAREIGVVIPDDVLPFINEVIANGQAGSAP